MTDTTTMSDGDFHHDLLLLVKREYGMQGLSRFMTKYCDGKGDYTRDRHIWLDDLTLEDILTNAKQDTQTQAA